jgi:hypothetical protein
MTGQQTEAKVQARGTRCTLQALCLGPMKARKGEK